MCSLCFMLDPHGFFFVVTVPLSMVFHLNILCLPRRKTQSFRNICLLLAWVLEKKKQDGDCSEKMLLQIIKSASCFQQLTTRVLVRLCRHVDFVTRQHTAVSVRITHHFPGTQPKRVSVTRHREANVAWVAKANRRSSFTYY